jgi:hypothetical protein
MMPRAIENSIEISSTSNYLNQNISSSADFAFSPGHTYIIDKEIAWGDQGYVFS